MPERSSHRLAEPQAFLEEYREGAGVRADGGGLDGRISFPEVHSFLEAPDEALEVAEGMVLSALQGHARRASGGRPPPVLLDRRPSARVHACAEILTTALSQQAKDLEVAFSPELPQEPVARALCGCFGLSADGAAASAGMMARLFQGDVPPELAQMRLSEWFSAQLSTDRYHVDKLLLQDTCGFVGEALYNALIHGAGDSWLGAVVRKDVVGALPRVELAIFNLGATMDETIVRMPASDEARAQLDRLREHHQTQGYFGGGWTPEALLVRHALQDRLTTFGTKKRTGGCGCMSMIGFFETLTRAGSDADARCAFVTGNTHVVLSNRYRLAPSRSVERPLPLRDLAFNDDNDFSLPADTQCFRTLKRRFPGTLVTLQFTLTQSHMTRREDSHEGQR